MFSLRPWSGVLGQHLCRPFRCLPWNWSSKNIIPSYPPTAFEPIQQNQCTMAMQEQRWTRCSCSGEITSSRNHPPAPFFLTPLNFAPTALTIIILPPTCFQEIISTPSSTHTPTAMNQKGQQYDRMVGSENYLQTLQDARALLRMMTASCPERG